VAFRFATLLRALGSSGRGGAFEDVEDVACVEEVAGVAVLDDAVRPRSEGEFDSGKNQSGGVSYQLRRSCLLRSSPTASEGMVRPSLKYVCVSLSLHGESGVG